MIACRRVPESPLRMNPQSQVKRIPGHQEVSVESHSCRDLYDSQNDLCCGQQHVVGVLKAFISAMCVVPCARNSETDRSRGRQSEHGVRGEPRTKTTGCGRCVSMNTHPQVLTLRRR